MSVLQIATIVGLIVIVQAGFFWFQWRIFWPRLLHRYPRFEYGFGREVFSPQLLSIIERAASRSEVELTWGAREMLAIPVIETIQMKGEVNWSEVEGSIEDILGRLQKTIGDDGAR
jgi:hypothetical protein